jgi:hypothetical protein
MVQNTENLYTGLLLEVRCQILSSQDNKHPELYPYKITAIQLFQLDLKARDHTEGGFKKW